MPLLVNKDFERLNKAVKVDPETGLVYWRATRHGARWYKSVGTLGKDGYLRIMIDGKRYLVHRVVYLLTHGHWPLQQIDHIDRNKINNRPNNLRDVSPKENTANSVGWRSKICLLLQTMRLQNT